jgi:hypothetical protein
MIVKPLLRGTVKATIGVALQVRKLAAEVSTDMATTSVVSVDTNGAAVKAGQSRGAGAVRRGRAGFAEYSDCGHGQRGG